MPIAGNWAYFDHAAVSPSPAPCAAAVAEWARDMSEQGESMWPQHKARVQKLRPLAAQLIGADPDEIALLRCTTEGINLVAEGFPWQPGDNVVTLADEFPANLYPWMNQAARGVETRRVPVDGGRVDLDRLADACDARTRIVTISWVSYSSGWRNDLAAVAELAHRRGALLFVDAIQGLGPFSLDAGRIGIDFLAAGGHKWLMGPEGTGLFYIRREHLDRLHLVGIGHASMVHAADYTKIEIDLKPTAARFEGSAINMVGLLGLAASVELLQSYDGAARAERILSLTDLCCRRLAEIGAVIASPRERPEHCSGIVLFDLPGRDPQEVRRRLAERHVQVASRAGKIRISPHVYCDESDIDRLIEELRAIK